MNESRRHLQYLKWCKIGCNINCNWPCEIIFQCVYVNVIMLSHNRKVPSFFNSNSTLNHVYPAIFLVFYTTKTVSAIPYTFIDEYLTTAIGEKCTAVCCSLWPLLFPPSLIKKKHLPCTELCCTQTCLICMWLLLRICFCINRSQVMITVSAFPLSLLFENNSSYPRQTNKPSTCICKSELD